jgi:hypothetical protein
VLAVLGHGRAVLLRPALYHHAEKRYPRSGAFEALAYQSLNGRAELLRGAGSSLKPGTEVRIPKAIMREK